MTLRIYNTLTRKKESFKPLKKGKVSFYACGVTVYDDCHVGHARAYVVFDTFRRLLEHLGYKVTYVQNFTDIDDKIITRSIEEKIGIDTLTETYREAYFRDMDQLNIKRADRYPQATACVPQMRDLIAQLVDKKAAYVTDSGEVLFSVSSRSDYGKLSHKVLKDLMAGIRVAKTETKKNPLDFVLWKPSKPGEPSWESPWGPGRPGWHTECAAMVRDEFGDTVDIHGGGEDLIFPHHENEIAQCESISGKPFARYWIHNGFVTLASEKMSKSKKNVFTIKEILKHHDGDVLRFFLQRVHYKSPLHFSMEGLEDAKHALARLKTTLQTIPEEAKIPSDAAPKFKKLEAQFLEALCDDLNMSEALAALFELNKLIHKVSAGSDCLRRLGDIIGLFSESEGDDEIPKDIKDLVLERDKARLEKDFTKADTLRKKIQDRGFVIEDVASGARVRPG